jgi:archaellin
LNVYILLIINRGDKACITVNLSACFNRLDSRADVRGMVIPELGAPTVIFFRTPATNSDIVVDFF